MRASRPVTVTLGDLQSKVDHRVKSGAYSSVSEVVRAGLRALDREEEALNGFLREKIRESLDDPRPSIPADEVFDRIERKHTARMNAAKRGS